MNGRRKKRRRRTIVSVSATMAHSSALLRHLKALMRTTSKARFEKGVLKVTLPKKPEAQKFSRPRERGKGGAAGGRPRAAWRAGPIAMNELRPSAARVGCRRARLWTDARGRVRGGGPRVDHSGYVGESRADVSGRGELRSAGSRALVGRMAQQRHLRDAGAADAVRALFGPHRGGSASWNSLGRAAASPSLPAWSWRKRRIV